MRRIIAVLAAALLVTGRAAAQGDSLTIREFRSDVAVQPDGSLEVTERLRIAFFGPWNGVLRDISLQHRTAQGARERLEVEVAPPTDAQGQQLRHQIERPDSWTRRVRIWVPDAHDAERTIVIRYRVEGAIRFFEEGSEPGPLDELYWNVTGNAWTMPIDRVEAHITLPAGITPDRMAAYTGVQGASDGEADVRTAGQEVTVTTRRRLAPGEGLTVGVGWAPGVIPRPTAAQRSLRTAGRRWPLGLPLVAFFLALRVWRRRGRDPEEREIAVAYEPPEGMSPAELGTLVDHRVDMQDITATLVDLAVRGYMQVEEREEKQLLGLISSTDYVFHLLRPREEWGELAEHERRFLTALFSAAPATVDWEVVKAAIGEARRAHAAGETVDGNAITSRMVAEAGSLDSVALSSLRNRFYSSLPTIKDAVYEKLMARGYYLARPDKVTGTWIGLGVALIVVSCVVGALVGGLDLRWLDGFYIGAAGVVSGIVVIAFGTQMPARTEAGARAREAALGFREFLDKVESDRYRAMITSPEMFERFLPYAMAFRVEERWAHAFEGLVQEPPDWYHGSGSRGFSPTAFTSSLGSMTTQAGSTMSSSPSSSGSSGGGSSGGGSGGGGGSGF